MMCDDLGYRRFAIRAIDMGVGVTTEMALSVRFCDGLHLSGANYWLGKFPKRCRKLRTNLLPKSKFSSRGSLLMPCCNPQDTNTRLWPERFSSRVGGMDCREIPSLERLPGQHRNALQQRRIANQPHYILGDQNHQLLNSPLSRVFTPLVTEFK